MSHDDVEMNNQNAKEEENRKTGSRAFTSDGVSYDGENFAKEDESMKHVDNFNLERTENKEGDAGYEKGEEEEEEQEEGDENEEQEEEEGEISAGKDEENNEDESSEELIDEEEEKSKDKNKEDKKGEKSENKENAADDKRRLMTLLMRELKDLETEN